VPDLNNRFAQNLVTPAVSSLRIERFSVSGRVRYIVTRADMPTIGAA
jgi:hypothetical protein